MPLVSDIMCIIRNLIFFLLIISFISSSDLNDFSIKNSTSSYWKLMPNIIRPFDDKDIFYKSLSSIDHKKDSSLFKSVSISNSLRKNKKQKSIKKLKNFEHKIEHGLNPNTYVIYNLHHGNNLIIPVVVDLNWYIPNAFKYNQRKKFEQKIVKNFTSKNRRSNQHNTSLKLINQDIAGTNVSLNLKGDITVNGEIAYEDKDLAVLNSSQNKSWDIDIEQTQQFDVEGQIGEKLSLKAKQDSEADFSWENDLTIKWDGTKNDILQLAEAGNISLSLPSTQFVSVGSGKSEGLFGIKTVHQFGPLEIQSILSREQVKKSAKTFTGGQTSEWSYINDYNFIKDRYFFIEQKFKDQYYPLVISNGALSHSFKSDSVIYKYKVYKKSTATTDDGVLDVVYGTAFINPLDSNSTQISGNWKKLYEGVDYEIDRLLGVLRLNTNPQEAIAIAYNYTTYDVQTGNFYTPDVCIDPNYDGLSINCEQYIDNNNNGDFDPAPNNGTDLFDECLDADYDGTSLECSDYIDNNGNNIFDTSNDESVSMKLIKLDGATTPNYETWPLMFKNVYSLGGSIADFNSLELDIVYNNGGLEETHSQVSNFQSFLTIFGLDTRNSNGEEIKDPTSAFYLGDGKLDNSTILINPIHGELFFPAHLPFAYDNNVRDYPTYNGNEFNYWDFSDQNNYWGIHSEDLDYYLDTDLNDQNNNFSSSEQDSGPAMYYSTDQGEITGEHEFMIKYKHSAGSSTINLGFMIVEGSETVTLNGSVLSRGIDYTIDYFSGTLNLINPDAMLPGANINITYEENELISFDQKLLFGTHFKYGFNNQNFISGGLFYYNQSIMEDNVDIGYEPMRNFIWNINGKFESDVDQLTYLTNQLPFINTTAPSSINFEGEFAEVYPNPNPLGQAFLDDFEASKRSTSIGLTSRNWKLSSPPVLQDNSEKDLESRGSMVWYNPYIEEQTINIWPDIETSTQAGNNYTKTLWLRPFFENSNYENHELWNGIITPLYSSDYDLSRKKYLEIWLNTENFEPNESISLHIDIGHISEDLNKDNLLNTEDVDVYGNGWGDNNLSDEEDIGIDLCPDIYEDGLGGCNCDYRNNQCDETFENTGTNPDPNGDNWCYNNDACYEELGIADSLRNTNYYKNYNGTEGNANLGRYPDTEDLDKDYNLDTSNDYFTTEINPMGEDYTDYIPETNWKLFRILLSDFDMVGDGSVTWSDVRNVRLWIDGMDSSYSYENSINQSENPKVIKIAKLEIVGNEWLELGSANIDDIPSINDDEFIEEPYFAVTVLNTHDNPNEYEPPNSEVEGEIDEITGIQMKEQSLVLSFQKSDDALDYGGIDYNQGLAIKKSFSVLPNDKKNSFFAYETLGMYVYGDPDNFGGQWEANDSSMVELLFRFGKDEQYYEIRQPIFEGWDNKNHIDISIDQLTQYKLEISLEDYEDVGVDGCLNNIENGFGSCLDTLSFDYYCNSVEPNFELINQDACNNYLNLSDIMKNSFDPNSDNYISEPSENFHPSDLSQRTENNYQYDYGEPFNDINEDGIFNPPPTEYLAADEIWRWEDNIESVCNNCSELRIKGAPAINNIEFVLVSVLNKNNQTIYGNVWLDELRMTGVKKEKGQAFRLKGGINFSDLLNVSSSFEQKDANFHLLQERLGTGNNTQSFSFSSKLALDKFFPNKWGLKIPVNINYLYNISSPKFYPGSDILSGDINSAPDDIKTKNNQSSFSTSFNKVSKSNNALIKYTLDQISFNFSFVDREKSTATIEKEISRDISFSSNYGYNFSDSNFLLPFKFLNFLPLIGNQVSDTRIYWSPEKFSTSINLSEHNQISTQRTGITTPSYSFTLDRKYSINYRFTKNIKLSYSKDIKSNFDNLFDNNSEHLNSYILDVAKSFSTGLIKNKSEGFILNFTPDFMKWLNPNIKYSSAYGWQLSNNQSDVDSLNAANVATNAILTSSISFSPSDLIEIYYTPETTKKRNTRNRGNQKKESKKEINNPALKSMFKYLHNISDRFSKINVSYSYKVNNSHSNILAGNNYYPDLMYRLGLTDNPHSDNIFFNNGNNIVNAFYHQYVNDFRISTNLSLTKKIQASIDYKNNNTLTNQSSSDATFNVSKTFFPMGIRGDDGFPIFNWNLNWSGLEKLPILNNIFRTFSVQHTFNGDNVSSYKDSEIQSWGYSRNFSPLIGFTAKTSNKNPVNLRANFVRNLYISNSGASTEQKHTTQFNGRIDFDRSGGLTLPIFFFRDFNISNDINFGFDISYDKSETLMSSVLIEEPSEFNQQDLSTSLSLKPKIGYSFTNYITGDLYFNYIITENKTTGKRKEQDFGFNIRIKIKG